MGADIVAAEGQSLGNALNFGGPYVGLFATPRKIRAPDAGTAGRRDRRCRRPARLGADPVDARAAHPPRKGDQQHLHQFRPLRARLYDPSGAARRSGADAAGAAQPCDGGHGSPSGSPRSPACVSSTEASSTNSRCACRRPAAEVVEALAESGILGGVPVSRFYPGRADLADLLLVAATETITRRRYRPARRRACGRCCDERVEPGLERPPGHRDDGGRIETISGNRGLQIEEKLIFEQDAPGRCGVDLPEPPPVSVAPRRARTAGRRSACRASASRRWCGISRGCRRRITRSTAGSTRSARAR